MYLLRKKLTNNSVALLLLWVCVSFFFLFLYWCLHWFLLFLNCPRWVFLGLRSFHLVPYPSVFWEKKDQNPFLPTIASHPSPPSPILHPTSFPPWGGTGGFSVPRGPSSLGLHRYTSLLLRTRMRVNTCGPGGAGLRGRLPLSPESLWRLRHIRYVWWDPPTADLRGRGWGGHGGGHGAAAAAAVEALGRLQPWEHGQRVREIGGRRWCVGWGAHLEMSK